MAQGLKIEFGRLAGAASGTAVIFAGEGVTLAKAAEAALPGCKAIIEKAAKTENFKGKSNTSMAILAPALGGLDKLVVIGTGKRSGNRSFANLGGYSLGECGKSGAMTIILALASERAGGNEAADFALGMRLRNYSFDRYKTKKKAGDDTPDTGQRPITIACEDAAAARKSMLSRDAVADGANLARDLVNEPPNVLFPVEFAKRAEALKAVGVEVEVLDEKALVKIGMRMLLAVGHGSANESRVVVMRWNGARNKSAKPVAFIGKGVTFDTGGISIKPAQGMEDMKGDMAGAACVTGLMHALAARKAKVNAVGVIGLVENMPDGKAQRPGDIVTSLSGQTVEIINTDAEGRLVLGDLLWYAQDRFKPEFMVNLATLTGAIIVALGSEHAGLFSNNDKLSARLAKAGLETGEKVWRMPLSAEYDKLMDSKVADMKNSGGRMAGSISAAQFLQRYVNDCAWAHLDIAGTAMGSPNTDTNRSWSSGWGVRLLDALVARHYEG